jgi:SAM-dependent methyltransferase
MTVTSNTVTTNTVTSNTVTSNGAASVTDEAPVTGTTAATFGAGGAEPYARALLRGDTVQLVPSDRDTRETTMDVARWNADADLIDLTLLGAVTGPTLDVGCGPGRMVRAALDLGMEVLGVDVSPTAISIAERAGLPVLERSVFDALPREGEWQTVLLVDGNVGIGGDVPALLARCAELLTTGGEIVVELSSDRDRDLTYTGTLVDSSGARSATFPWAEVGLTRLIAIAPGLGLDVRQSWELGERNFCRLAAHQQ